MNGRQERVWYFRARFWAVPPESCRARPCGWPGVAMIKWWWVETTGLGSLPGLAARSAKTKVSAGLVPAGAPARTPLCCSPAVVGAGSPGCRRLVTASLQPPCPSSHTLCAQARVRISFQAPPNPVCMHYWGTSAKKVFATRVPFTGPGGQGWNASFWRMQFHPEQVGHPLEIRPLGRVQGLTGWNSRVGTAISKLLAIIETSVWRGVTPGPSDPGWAASPWSPAVGSAAA